MSNHSRPNYDGVRFYSANDLSTRINLKHSEDVIMDYENNLNNSDINYILELYNITLLFQLNIIIDEWDEEYYEKLTNIVKRFPARIGQFFSTIDDTQLILLYQNVCINYITSFWAAFEHYDLYKNISAEIFGEFLKREDVHLRDILTHKKLVNAYNYELSIYMLSEYNCAEIIIEQLLVKREDNDRIYYLPRDLTPEKRITLLEEYINSDSPNPNYIEVIITGKSSKELPITPKLRLLANRKHNAMMVEFFSHNQGFAYGPSVIFKEMTADIEFDNSNPLKPKLSYSSTWISENPDYPTILNNFIYLFEYTDGHYRSTFPAKRTHIGVFEDIFGLKGKNAYTTGMSFNLCDNISLLQMAGYYQQLLQNKIQLESVFQWFFETYLKTEFNVAGFILTPPSSDSTFLEKHRTMCSELDGIIKQFNLFVEDGYIDRELLEITSATPLFSQVKSMIKQKYGYVNDDTLNTILFLLFSDQATLSYTDKTKSSYTTFANLILHENMEFSDFHSYQQHRINILIDNDIIYTDSNNFLKITSEKYVILKDLYENEVICTTYFKSDYLKQLVYEGKIQVEETLFSRIEQDYLDYMLNDHKFTNGPKLRNKYSHGTNSTNTLQHEQDYYQLLKIFSLLIIKINEEFIRSDKSCNNS